jgi:cytochrome P450
VAVFAEWMNMPEKLVDTLRETARAYVYAVQRFNGEEVKETSYKLYDMARALIAQRKQAPLDPQRDITSALLAATDMGQPLPDEMIVGAVRQILVVGIVAPNVMIGGICVHLSRYPELQSRLRNNLHLVPNAIEEYLRLFTPYRGFARTPTRDVIVNDVLIRQGEPIALNYASANRDDAVFPDADQFILDRPNLKDHLAFGRGPHNCPGAWLARLELTIALEEILVRTRHFQVSGPVEVTLCPEIGALSVPLTWEAA